MQVQISLLSRLSPLQTLAARPPQRRTRDDWGPPPQPGPTLDRAGGSRRRLAVGGVAEDLGRLPPSPQGPLSSPPVSTPAPRSRTRLDPRTLRPPVSHRGSQFTDPSPGPRVSPAAPFAPRARASTTPPTRRGPTAPSTASTTRPSTSGAATASRPRAPVLGRLPRGRLAPPGRASAVSRGHGACGGIPVAATPRSSPGRGCPSARTALCAGRASGTDVPLCPVPVPPAPRVSGAGTGRVRSGNAGVFDANFGTRVYSP